MKIELVHTPFEADRPLTTIPHLIRKVANTFFNHCSILQETNGLKWIVESDISGVVDVKLEKWVRHQIVDEFEIPSDQERYYHNRAQTMIGKFKYSFWDLIWFMPIYIFTKKWYGQTIEDSKNRPTCYEFVARVLEMDNWYRMTPNELKEELIRRGYKQTRFHEPATNLLK